MTSSNRPSIRGMAPSEVLDGAMQPLPDGKSMRKHAGADYWDFITVVAFDDVVGANLVFAGPTSGAAASPTFRALVVADLPGTVALVPFQDGTVPGGNTVANTVTRTAFASSFSIAANTLTVGTVIRVRARGTYGTAIAAPTLAMRLLYGATALLASGTITMTAGLNTATSGWLLEGDFIVTAIGGGGTIESQGSALFGNVAGNAKGGDIWMLTNTAAVAAATNATKSITIDVQWGTAAAANTITMREMTVDVIKP